MPPTPNNNNFRNPFDSCVAENSYRRLNADVDKGVYDFLRSIRLTSGTIQTTVNILLKKLYDELLKRNIRSSADVDAFEHFVTNCTLSLPSGGIPSGTGGLTHEANVPDDGRGA